jgi:site-specific DNA-methyltransferase (adenine-specific)
MFPEELPRRLIRMFSFTGETVLDPFLGSGTTSLAAARLGRNSVGYEINEDFSAQIRTRLEAVDGVSYETDEAALSPDAAGTLPYRFVDPLRLDKQVDPRTITFGSRISERDHTQMKQAGHKRKKQRVPAGKFDAD